MLYCSAFIFSIVMNRQRKLNLHSPYLAISDSLWHSKQTNSHQEKENTRLRTKLFKITHSTHPNTPEDAENQRLAHKFKQLAQQHK